MYCRGVKNLLSGVTDVEARRVSDDSWTEGGITWNNQPAYGDVEDTKVPAVGWVEWNVLSWVQNEYAGDKTVSICLKCKVESYDNNARYSYYASKEYDASDPELYIEYTTGQIYTQTVTEKLGMADSVARSVGFRRTISDSLGMVDGLLTKVTLTRTISETLGLVDSVASRADFRQVVHEDLGMVDSVVPKAEFHLEISEILGMVDSVERARGQHVTISEIMGMVDSVLAEVGKLPPVYRRYPPPEKPPIWRKERYRQKVEPDQVSSRISALKKGMVDQYDAIASKQQDLWERVQRSTSRLNVRPELTFYFYAMAEELVRVGERFRGGTALREMIIVRDKWIRRGLDVDAVKALLADLGMANLVPS
jgi:hypothetical protein